MSRVSRIAIAQLNFTVGDIAGNCTKILHSWQQAENQSADLIIFPEMAVTGYPPEDLLLLPHFCQQAVAALQELAEFSAGMNAAAIIGGLHYDNSTPRNSLFLIENGKLIHSQSKIALPNYGVFDELRYFEPGYLPPVVIWRGFRLGLMICEDLWQQSLSEHFSYQAVDLVIVINGSPFEQGKNIRRLELARQSAKYCNAPLIYVNMIGGQDEIVFDGNSFIINSHGELVAQLAAFTEQLFFHSWPLERASPFQFLPLNPWEELYAAMKLGLRDYVHKSGFSDVVIGLSGGIDSALTAAVAVDAFGAEHVHTVFMPSPYTSQESYIDATECAALLGVSMQTVPIGSLMENMQKALQPVFGNLPPDITEENLQSRLRGNLLMALSNKFGWLLLTTGNKSEMATGYATLYGDMCGAYNILKDLYKTQIFSLSHWRNQQSRVIPERILTKPPSAELKPNQTDQDSLPPYDILDAILKGLIEERVSVSELNKRGFAEALVRKVENLLRKSEYKRKQAPPGLKLFPTAFGRDWRFPLVNRFKE